MCMCVHVISCACVFRFADLFRNGEGFTQVSLYTYVCACESMCVCVFKFVDVFVYSEGCT